LPEYHYIEQDVSAFELSPGETKNIWVKVLPQKRHIQMTDGGMLAEEIVMATGPEKVAQKEKISKSVPPPIKDGVSKIRLGKLRKASDYTVQVAVYSEQKKARKVLENLRRGGFNPYIVRTKDSDRHSGIMQMFGRHLRRPPGFKKRKNAR